MKLIVSIFLLGVLVVSCSSSEEVKEKNTDSVEENMEKDTIVDTIDSIEADTVEMDIVEETVSEEYDDIDWEAYEQSMTKDFSFVILISTKDYDAALRRAKDASEKLGYPMDLRGLTPNEEVGLTVSEEVCESICGGGVVECPIYLPRSDWGETKYVSVEYSDGFDGFTKGYYIVVVASGLKGDPIIKEALQESKQFYKDAYAKTCGVWVGCRC
jgi:hypothetical protein